MKYVKETEIEVENYQEEIVSNVFIWIGCAFKYTKTL